jgi:hypothetical protein
MRKKKSGKFAGLFFLHQDNRWLRLMGLQYESAHLLAILE